MAVLGAGAAIKSASGSCTLCTSGGLISVVHAVLCRDTVTRPNATERYYCLALEEFGEWLALH